MKGKGLLAVGVGGSGMVTRSPGSPLLSRTGTSSKQIQEWPGQATDKIIEQRIGCSPDSGILRLGGDQEP